jgi:hypothetical protein
MLSAHGSAPNWRRRPVRFFPSDEIETELLVVGLEANHHSLYFVF